MVRRTCPVSDDPEGSKLCPQGTFPFSSLMPSSSDTFGARDTKFGTGVQCNKVFQNFEKLGGPKIRGVKILDFLKKKLFRSFLDEICQNAQNWVKKIFGVKNLIFRKFFITILPNKCITLLQ